MTTGGNRGPVVDCVEGTMDVQTPEAKTQATPVEAPKLTHLREAPKRSSVPAIIVGVVIAAIAGLSIWYLVRPVPLLANMQAGVLPGRLAISTCAPSRSAP